MISRSRAVILAPELAGDPPHPDPEVRAKPWHLLRVHCESLHRSGLPYRVCFDLPAGRITIWAKGTPQPIPSARAPHNGLPPKMTLDQAQRGLRDQLALVARLRDRVARRWRSWRERDWSPSYDPVQRAKRRRFGRWLASRCAVRRNRLRLGWELPPGKEEYAICDAALGWRCPRQSQLYIHERTHGWLWAVAHRYLGINREIEPYRRRPGAARCTQPGADRCALPMAAPAPASPSPPGAPVERHPPTQSELIYQYRSAKIDLEYWHEMVRLTGGGGQ